MTEDYYCLHRAFIRGLQDGKLSYENRPCPPSKYYLQARIGQLVKEDKDYSREYRLGFNQGMLNCHYGAIVENDNVQV